VNQSVASLIYYCGIAGLFFLNRDKSIRTSKALWLPVLYLWVIESRPISFWLGNSSSVVLSAQAQLDGSPMDAAFFGILLVIGIVVLAHRGDRARKLLGASWPVLAYFAFCLLSVLWSNFPGIAFKRWIKASGDLVMILVVLTDEQPSGALIRLYSRTGFILLPMSLLWMKYYPALGRQFDPWTGQAEYIGVSYNKNIVGLTVFTILLGTIWRLVELLRYDKKFPCRRRILIAQAALLAIGIYLLSMADSDTSTISLCLGAGLMLATCLKFVRRNPAAVHVLVVTLAVAVSFLMLNGGDASMAHAVGRKANLTGRTSIWAGVIPLCPNPVIGAGFESFWLNSSVHTKLWEEMPGLPLNESHDGYIEAYVELGWVGVCLIALIVFEGYRRSVAAFRRDPVWGGLLIAYILSATVYNVTEAGFRMMNPMWIFLLLAVVGSGGVVSGALPEAAKPKRGTARRIGRIALKKWWAPGDTVRRA
jgi:exopolysaccharide production protein ExoQ